MFTVRYLAVCGRVQLELDELPVDGVGATVEDAADDLLAEIARYVTAYLADPDCYFVRGGCEAQLPYVLAAEAALVEDALAQLIFG